MYFYVHVVYGHKTRVKTYGSGGAPIGFMLRGPGENAFLNLVIGACAILEMTSGIMSARQDHSLPEAMMGCVVSCMMRRAHALSGLTTKTVHLR